MTSHVAPLSLRCSKNSSAQENHGAGATQMSCTKVFDPVDYRAFFAERWAGFLRENYRNPETVAVAFGVRYQTALNWWQGVNRPSGDVVARAFLQHGDAVARHLEG